MRKVGAMSKGRENSGTHWSEPSLALLLNGQLIGFVASQGKLAEFLGEEFRYPALFRFLES